MIRHRPYGRGHAYLIEPDQRVPAQPLAGEPLELRATTPAAVDEVVVEAVIDGRPLTIEARRRGPAVAEELPNPGAAGGPTRGHLTAVAERRSSARSSWAAAVDGLAYGVPLRYRFAARSGGRVRRTRWFAVSPARWEPTGGELAVEGPTDRLVPHSVAWLVDGAGPCRVRLALRLEPGERIVGFGERFNALDQRGRRIDSVVFEQYTRQGDRTYIPMPFAIVAGGEFGFHLDTSRRVWFDVGASDPNRLWIEADVDRGDPSVRLRLLAGGPAEVLRAFLDRTGPPALPPEWVFRPWMSSNEWNTQERVMAEVERGECEGIPAGVVVIEAWSDEQTFVAFRDAEYDAHPDGKPHRLADFRFPAGGAWPDPKGMVDDLHARGMKLLLWQIPLARAGAPPGSQGRHDWETMIARGYAVRQGDGRAYRNRGWWFPRALLPDFTNPEATDWWLAKRRYLVEELGIDGFKTDGGEHAWGHDLHYADGTTGAETNNRFPVLYAAAYHRLLAEVGREGTTFSRAGFTGSPAYPCHWAGDEGSTWEAFRASIVAGLTAGSSGIFFWGWDHAGFSGELPTAELYLRAAAAACFSPIMQYHSEFNFHRRPSNDRTPWNVAERTGDDRVVPVYRRYAQLRDRLVPYLVEQARRSVTTARPLMRPLFFDVDGDERIWDFPLQYLLGDGILVAPVCEPGADAWPVLLPPGGWRDAWTGEAVAGGTIVDRAVPLDVIPIYLREPADTRLAAAFVP